MSDDPLYREIILEHWQNPQNFGVIDNADIDVTGKNPTCGDQIRITARKKDGRITDIAFTGEGCAISKASTSLFTESIKGKTTSDVKKIPETEIIEALGVPISPARTKCALLAYSTLQRDL